jgi:hypothetical protein
MSERTERLIRDYPANKTRLEFLKNQLSSFQGVTEQDVIDTMLFSQPDGERVQSNSISDKTAGIALNYRKRRAQINREWYEHLERQYMDLQDEICFFEGALRSLSGVEGAVLADQVLNGVTWDELCERYHVCRTMIGKYRKKAISELDRLYQSHDAEMVAYMLS